jgi:YHS domain-containing protein
MKNALNIIAVVFTAVCVVCAAGCAEKTQTTRNETRASEQVTPVVATTVPLTATTPTATSAPSVTTPAMNPGKYINSGTIEDKAQKASEQTMYLVKPAATGSMDSNSLPVIDTVEPAATDNMDSNSSPAIDTVEPAVNDSMNNNSSPVIDMVEPAANDSADPNSSTVIDAVCKTRINKRAAEFKSEYNGKTYYFCSADCKQKFDKNPDKYVIAHTGALVAIFNASPTSGNAPLNVAFTDISTGTPTSWNWNFGDGANSTHKNAVHIYSKKGKYNVTLTVKNANGNNKITKYGYISVDSSKVTDAVCKMKIDKRKAEFKSVYKGKTYYFCSANCKIKFYKNPEKYIS